MWDNDNDEFNKSEKINHVTAKLNAYSRISVPIRFLERISFLRLILQSCFRNLYIRKDNKRINVVITEANTQTYTVFGVYKT